MFGEGESESPRVPSPWDSFISTPPDGSPRRSPSPASAITLPKLVPENDDGNVEYKLQLINPSPARFARLVTQLKWRLLEGGGQAYYELGVSDSGELIGLSSSDLERTLETLEMMAGEIGASVIVVKEVEIPQRMLPASPSESTTDVETSGTEFEDTETETEPDLPEDSINRAHSDTIFSMDSDFEERSNTLEVPGASPPVALSLEIASVYKPRPFRQRVHDPRNMIVPGKRDRHHTNGKKRGLASTMMASTATKEHNNTSLYSKETKSLTRRQARDKRREERRAALMITTQAGEADESSVSQRLLDEVTEGLESLHVPTSHTLAPHIHSQNVRADPHADLLPCAPGQDRASMNSPSAVVPADSEREHLHPGDTNDVPSVPITVGSSPRLIVEALVVRKMSIEEAYLDFGGFQIT
ncbi:hypothetical protein PLEOSDRAFT_162822 [Pleurotus ostreatus PC15]|uniref:Uncharacterized protein n=1 Tax=Pleurotus ostreatus (strain PC15) TaxID=1137138 RepID=A0A067N850_PLEO1|nr:hypothetical protein PLEOSDRAFT_162822 [Pleurotus ostreatus PC15]